MKRSIGDMRHALCAHLDELATTGDPIHIVNNRRRGSPTEAIVVSPELWDVLMSQPGAKKRVKEFLGHQQQQEAAA